MFQMGGPGALFLVVPQADKLNKDEVQSLLRVGNMPAEEIESRAKARGLWHPKGEGPAPREGDLVTFSIDKDSCSPHVGLVTAVNHDGTIRVRSESLLRIEKTTKLSGRSDNAVDEAFTLKASEIRGTISKRPEKGSNSKSFALLDDILTAYGLLNLHADVKNLLTELLKPDSARSSKKLSNGKSFVPVESRSVKRQEH